MVFWGNRMVAAASSPVSQSSVHSSFVPQPCARRQHRQRFLEWDRDETADTRVRAISRTAAPTEQAPIERAVTAGPRRMGDVMPDVLARYGLKL
jgi:hypothetical protein